ncbi:alpha/beta fold hydrolase [Pseudomonas citronellolis]|uniref:alpha/beta fold hydrolase n=1 Tax=Pseudomonas citronellolis TaxID=53408 RepID=UPI0021BDFADD|nr:alpha/beta hydrolase [Pseudomonas citronellolis]UXJ50093.1 alpha/beta hydrolase [Pseudomonas citronellolis]
MPMDNHFFTNRSGLRLHFLRWGLLDGVPVILLHGLRAYAQTWEPLATALGDDFCCYALDQRGRGLSDWAEPSSYRTESYVQDLEDLVAHLGLGKFVLVGHSLGGANALEYARQHPGRLRGLVIEDIGPGSSSTSAGAERIRRDMRETPLWFADWSEAERFWRRFRPGLSEQEMAYAMRETADGIAWRHDQQGIAEARLNITPTDLWPAVRALSCPTLFIRGGRSDFLPSDTMAAMSEANSHIRTVEVADASHCVHDDQRENFNAVVVAYLAGLLERQP